MTLTSQLTIGGGVNVSRQVRDSNLEAGLDLGHNLLVGVGRDERNGQTLRAEATSTAARVGEQ